MEEKYTSTSRRMTVPAGFGPMLGGINVKKEFKLRQRYALKLYSAFNIIIWHVCKPRYRILVAAVLIRAGT